MSSIGKMKYTVTRSTSVFPVDEFSHAAVVAARCAPAALLRRAVRHVHSVLKQCILSRLIYISTVFCNATYISTVSCNHLYCNLAAAASIMYPATLWRVPHNTPFILNVPAWHCWPIITTWLRYYCDFVRQSTLGLETLSRQPISLPEWRQHSNVFADRITSTRINPPLWD
jgi:hypothetical protein